MIDSLLDFLTGRAVPEQRTDQLQLSVAALLIEAARMDSNFDAAERGMIERLLAKRFDLAPDAVRSLVEEAQRKLQNSAQYFPFTREIAKRLDSKQRVEIIEMLWKVAYSDGALDPHEDTLLRQIAGLIDVPDKERGEARLRALEQLKRLKEPQ